MLDNAQLETLRASAVPESGNRVQLAIDLCGKKQGEVASDMGMTQSQLSDIARGRFTDFKWSTVRKLTAYFGCLSEDLFPSAQPLVVPGVEVREKSDRRSGTDRREGVA